MTQPATRPDGADAPRASRRANGAAATATKTLATSPPAGPPSTQTPATAKKSARTTRKPTGPRRPSVAPVAAGATAAQPDLAALKPELVDPVRSHSPQANLEPIERAFDLAVEAHASQRR